MAERVTEGHEMPPAAHNGRGGPSRQHGGGIAAAEGQGRFRPLSSAGSQRS